MHTQPKASRREFWQQVLARQQASGLSIQRFCQRERLAAATFFQWKRRLRREGSPPAPAEAVGFAPVRIVAESAGDRPAGTIEIVLAGQRRIRLSGRVDQATLADVLAVLEGPRSC